MEDLLLLHGAIGAKDQLQPLAGMLKDQFEVRSLNFSGHGGAAFSKEFSIAHFAGEVLSYLSENKIGRTNIFGYSMGGYVAMYLARHHPSMVTRLVTLATKFYWDPDVAAREAKMLNADRISEKIPVFAKQLEQRHLPNDWKEVLGKTKEMLLRLGENNELKPADYQKISIPCLLLLGEKDKMITMEETVEVNNNLPDSTLKILPNTPHPIEQVDPGMLAPIIQKFCSS
jgi:pimeloyl-ACP methyl ester carboxylesterase